jgi:hypothetical protein
MKRLDLTPAEIAADPRFDGALEHADAYLGEYVYRPVVFTVTRKGKLQWRSVDDAGKVVRQFNWHANARVWVRSTFSWSYRERVRARGYEQIPAIQLGHQGRIAAGDTVFVHPDGIVRAYPPTAAGAVVQPIGIALTHPDADGTVRVVIGYPVAIQHALVMSDEHSVLVLPGGE